MSLRTRLVASALLALGLLTSGSAAHAEDPLRLPDRVTDSAGVLDDARVEAAIETLRDGTDDDLFVVYVDSFDGMDRNAWAEETFALSGMGSRDVLLAVAVEDREYTVYVDGSSALSDDRLDAIDVAVEDQLRDGDWTGAAVAAAQTLGDSGGSNVLGVLFGAGIIVIALVAVVMWFSARKRRGSIDSRENEISTLSTAELGTRASSALIAVDDRVRSAEQELGFAQAQFGDEATDTFARTLEEAKAKVTRAFTLRHQLDDTTPEPEPRKRVMLAEIIALGEQVGAALTEGEKQFAELRDLQARVPEVIVEVRGRVATATARIEPARAIVAGLAVTFPASALTSIGMNPDQALRLLTAANESLGTADACVAAGDRATAVAHTRVATQAVVQAGVLLDAVDTARTDLAQAGPRLDAAVASLRGDLADAARLAGSDAAVDSAARQAQQVVDEVLRTRDGGDPLAAIRTVADAESALDAVLAPSREQADQAARTTAQLQDSLGRVGSLISGTRDFVSTRQGAVGSEARTRLSEAIRLHDEARGLAAPDPSAALDCVRRAEQLALSARQLADRDVDTWQRQNDRNDSDGTGLAGILTGILLGSGNNSGGYRSSGGWSSSGSGRSSSRSSSSRRSSSGRSRGGSFGGGGRSSGGGRSRGGRF